MTASAADQHAGLARSVRSAKGPAGPGGNLRAGRAAVLACTAMRTRASISLIAKAVALLCAISASGCTGPSGRLAVDIAQPHVLPYQPPDIDDITGIDSDDEEDAKGAGTGSAQKPHK